MADRFEQLKLKYQSVLNFIQSQGVQLQNLNMEGDKLLIRASAPSADLKNRVWDQIKLVDPNFSDLIADIQAPAAAAAAAAAAGASSTPAARTYTVQPGDNLSKISKQFYGDANKYMKIFEANKDKLTDPDKVKAGMDLLIPRRLSAAAQLSSSGHARRKNYGPIWSKFRFEEATNDLDRSVGKSLEAIHFWRSRGGPRSRRACALRSGDASRSRQCHYGRAYRHVQFGQDAGLRTNAFNVV